MKTGHLKAVILGALILRIDTEVFYGNARASQVSVPGSNEKNISDVVTYLNILTSF